MSLPVWLGCQSILGFEEFDTQGGGAAAGGSSTGGSAGSSGGAGGATPCEAGGSPGGMVGVRLGDGECTWFDQTEVTRAAYDEFLDQVTDPAPHAHPGACNWKPAGISAYAPACANDGSAPTGGDDLPVTCVDWCDAWAYCAFRGKFLCDESQWSEACSSGGPQHNYPYGAEYDPGACNGSDNLGLGCNPECTLAPAGDQTQCVTPNGISDMSGNAAEWVNDCSGYSSEAQTCKVQGGSVAQAGSALLCSSSVSSARNSRLPFVGFRCCWQPS